MFIAAPSTRAATLPKHKGMAAIASLHIQHFQNLRAVFWPQADNPKTQNVMREMLVSLVLANYAPRTKRCHGIIMGPFVFAQVCSPNKSVLDFVRIRGPEKTVRNAIVPVVPIVIMPICSLLWWW